MKKFRSDFPVSFPSDSLFGFTVNFFTLYYLFQYVTTFSSFPKFSPSSDRDSKSPWLLKSASAFPFYNFLRNPPSSSSCISNHKRNFIKRLLTQGFFLRLNTPPNPNLLQKSPNPQQNFRSPPQTSPEYSTKPFIFMEDSDSKEGGRHKTLEVVSYTKTHLSPLKIAAYSQERSVVGEKDEQPMIPRLSERLESRGVLIFEGDRESEEDLQVVLNNSHMPIGTERMPRVGKDDDGDGESLAIVAYNEDTSQQKIMDKQEWGGENGESGADGEKKKLGEPAKEPNKKSNRSSTVETPPDMEFTTTDSYMFSKKPTSNDLINYLSWVFIDAAIRKQYPDFPYFSCPKYAIFNPLSIGIECRMNYQGIMPIWESGFVKKALEKSEKIKSNLPEDSKLTAAGKGKGKGKLQGGIKQTRVWI